MEYHVLNKPPLTEAIFEVLLKYPEDVTVDLLKGFKDLLPEAFSAVKNIYHLKARGEFPANEKNIETSIIGYIFSDEKENVIIQARLNGFAYIQANKTYTKWEDFQPKAMEIFSQYIQYSKANLISRISLRFINHIELPYTDILHEYILTIPMISKDIKLPSSNMYLKVEMPSQEFQAMGVITEMINAPSTEVINLFYDIDVIKEFQPNDLGQIDLNDLNDKFEELRRFKNFLFFNSFTDKAKGLFT